ncbi:MAG: hypothetical protein ABR985_15420 [Methanotrichaceae archaeon]|jgi:hypothetical protein
MVDIDTIKKDIDRCTDCVKQLRIETYQCGSLQSSGDIVIVDEAGLEARNTEIDRLNHHRQENSDVLSKLLILLEGAKYESIAALRARINKVTEDIYYHENDTRVSITQLLATTPGLDPLNDLQSQPRVIEIVKKNQPRIDADKKELENIKQVLASATAIISEFKPSEQAEKKVERVQLGRGSGEYGQIVGRDMMPGL